MIRTDIISTVGREYLTSNIENDEYSYPKAFSSASLTFVPIRNSSGRAFEKLDIRFVKENITVLIETKQNFTKTDEEQLSAYVEYEKALTGNKTIAILANTTNANIKVWRGVVSDSDFMPKETALRTMDEYVDFYTSKINDKEKVMQNTYKLNEMLHRHSIPEKLRSQFVGTCLLALKNGLDYATPSLSAAQIRTRIKEVLEELAKDKKADQTYAFIVWQRDEIRNLIKDVSEIRVPAITETNEDIIENAYHLIIADFERAKPLLYKNNDPVTIKGFFNTLNKRYNQMQDIKSGHEKELKLEDSKRVLIGEIHECKKRLLNELQRKEKEVMSKMT